MSFFFLINNIRECWAPGNLVSFLLSKEQMKCSTHVFIKIYYISKKVKTLVVKNFSSKILSI